MLDYFRGPDSTGLAAIQGDDAKIAKIASNPVNLFDMKRFTGDCLHGYKSQAFIGHNRSATKGAVNDVNAHPYEYGHIVGAHNGTLSTQSWAALEAAIGEKTGTDSAAIFACIAKIGIEETVKLLQGAWALVWYDFSDKTLNFLRNKERPFWYAYGKDFKRVFWASEHWMIRAAVAAAGPMTTNSGYELHVDNGNHSFFSTKEDWHYRYDIEALRAGSDTIPKPKAKELKGKESAPTQVASTHFPVRQITHQQGSEVRGTGRTTTTGSTGHLVRKVETTAAKPYGDYFTQEKFEEIAIHGCKWCGEDVSYYDEGTVVFEGQSTVICSECSCKETSRVYADPAHMDAYIDSQNNTTVVSQAA